MESTNFVVSGSHSLGHRVEELASWIALQAPASLGPVQCALALRASHGQLALGRNNHQLSHFLNHHRPLPCDAITSGPSPRRTQQPGPSAVIDVSRCICIPNG